jgi:2-polyprenyl-3-methyl-5-hydroxy-6-metoxy-1,4-benzoquinol methylase
MEMDEKTRWDKKHSERSHRSLEPDPFLVSAYNEFLAGPPAGSALDVAGGAGRHAIWLAEHGWHVTLIDISEVGVQHAQENARRSAAGGLIVTKVQDLNTAQDLGREQYDLLLVFSFLQRELFPALTAALKTGGHLIYKTYTTEQLRFDGGPRKPTFLLQPNELLHAFPSMQVLHYHETIQEKGVAELVAKK